MTNEAPVVKDAEAEEVKPRSSAEPELPSQAAMRSLDLIRSLRRYPGWGLGVIVLVLAVGLPLAWLKGRPVYEASGTLHVAPRFMKNLEEDLEHQFQSNNQYREFVQHQVHTINRFDVLAEALDRLGDRRTVWQRPHESERKAAERLQPALTIKPVPDTYLITVSLERGEPEGLADVVNAVMASYLDVARREEFYGVDQRVASLRAEQDSLQQSLEPLIARRTAIAQELGVTTFVEARPNSYDQLLVDNQEALAAARRRRIEAESQLAALDVSQRVEGDAALEAAVQTIVDKDNVLASARAGLTTRRNELVLKLSGLAPDHPGRRGLERDLAVVDKEMARISEVTLAHARRIVLDDHRAKLFEARRIERSLTELFDQQYARASRYAELYSEALRLGTEADRIQKRLDAVNDRLNFLSLESKAPGFVRVVTPARAPERPVRGGRTKMFFLVLMAAGGLGFIVPVLLDMSDRRIRSGSELATVLGFAPIADFPSHHSGKTETRLGAVSLRRLAISLLRERRRRAAMTVCVTSVQQQAGQSTLLWGLGYELQRLGLRTVLVDVNPLSADRRYQREDTKPGLMDALNDNAKPEEIVSVGAEGGPDTVCLGAGSGTACLNNGSRLERTLRALSARYDLVLLDAAPVLDSADTELLCLSTDLTMLVVEAERVTADEARRAARTLERLSLPLVASVVTKVSLSRGGERVTPWSDRLNVMMQRYGVRQCRAAVPFGESSGGVA